MRRIVRGFKGGGGPGCDGWGAMGCCLEACFFGCCYVFVSVFSMKFVVLMLVLRVSCDVFKTFLWEGQKL